MASWPLLHPLSSTASAEVSGPFYGSGVQMGPPALGLHEPIAPILVRICANSSLSGKN